MALVLDTHAVIWYLRASKDLSPTALQAIRHTVSTGRPVHVSAISLIEAIYLTEKGRLPVEALQRLESALKDPDSGLVIAPVDIAVAEVLRKVSALRYRYAGPHYRGNRTQPECAPSHPDPAPSVRGNQDDLVIECILRLLFYSCLLVDSSSSIIFCLFEIVVGQILEVGMSNEASKNKTTIAIYIQSPNRLDSRGLKAQVTGD